MRIFRLFNHKDQIKTRKNKDNVYTDLTEAKWELKLYLKRVNRRVMDKNSQVKDTDCSIIEYELVQTNTFHL